MPQPFDNEQTVTDRDGDMIGVSPDVLGDRMTGNITVRILDQDGDYRCVILTPAQVGEFVGLLEDSV